jgi:hypothetical protein
MLVTEVAEPVGALETSVSIRGDIVPAISAVVG